MKSLVRSQGLTLAFVIMVVAFGLRRRVLHAVQTKTQIRFRMLRPYVLAKNQLFKLRRAASAPGNRRYRRH
jgi:hypothetical protein